MEEKVQDTLTWARAMQEWLTKYESHIEELVENKEIPKPPPW